MREATALLFALQICWLASVARAETQVRAEDCSSAVSGTLIGSHIEIVSAKTTSRVLLTHSFVKAWSSGPKTSAWSGPLSLA
jgi:hypothetical protein